MRYAKCKWYANILVSYNVGLGYIRFYFIILYINIGRVGWDFGGPSKYKMYLLWIQALVIFLIF